MYLIQAESTFLKVETENDVKIMLTELFQCEVCSAIRSVAISSKSYYVCWPWDSRKEKSNMVSSLLLLLIKTIQDTKMLNKKCTENKYKKLV